MKMHRQGAQLRYFLHREEPPGYFVEPVIFFDPFDIDAYLMSACDAEECHLVRVREIEAKAAAGKFGCQAWFAVYAANEWQVRRLRIQIFRQDRAQRGVGDDKRPPVLVELESRRTLLLSVRKKIGERPICAVRLWRYQSAECAKSYWKFRNRTLWQILAFV